MVELQSCACMVNDSALCAIEQEMKGDSTVINAIASISAELQKEREKNSELMQRISALEAQTQGIDKNSSTPNGQCSCISSAERNLKIFKRQKIETCQDEIEEKKVDSGDLASQLKNDDLAVEDYDDDSDDSYEEEDFDEFDNQINHKNIIRDENTSADDPVSDKEACRTRPGGNILLSNRKVAFCPKEVKRILESEVLLEKNAQSHTMRKIIVFASLGIRHGCDDMYELDFNHFTIQRKGEPYVSVNDPGEHVVYENPGVRSKILFPNRQNPTLCPLRVLEEEKAMRPSDPNCPSCLFLCIKYGGRTRNLPQNEYVRQRMGRNKLKSFGPVMCRIASLVHIRSGSFFFKSLGITLLFMAGFPDDLVQRETKYRNLDLLQKYYRTDEDAEREQLFASHPTTCDNAGPGSEKLAGKTVSTKSKARKQAKSISKATNLPESAVHQSIPSPPTRFGLMGYTSIQTQPMVPFQSIPSQTPYHMFAPQPANSFMPMVYWSAPNAFPYASTYGYQAFPSAANYLSIQPHPYYSHPSCSSLIPKMAERNLKNDAVLADSDCVSDSSSSSSTDPK
ncbi:uncharacterized protein LOC126664722 isoform X2 [Mercurialis annua]|uniref:uncharacterized protein LOC126664722 isoform X2 n=1 Tax=Mercurialis annua TaxID=3986 RepID=UPI002160181B|nr:uncharacterized protein LOC126664722 isoform X2 [Mercurialis annua]